PRKQDRTFSQGDVLEGRSEEDPAVDASRAADPVRQSPGERLRPVRLLSNGCADRPPDQRTDRPPVGRYRHGKPPAGREACGHPPTAGNAEEPLSENRGSLRGPGTGARRAADLPPSGMVEEGGPDAGMGLLKR